MKKSSIITTLVWASMAVMIHFRPTWAFWTAVGTCAFFFAAAWFTEVGDDA